MNRFLTLLAFALTISLSSCMKGTKYEASPVQGGLEIYQAVMLTQNAAMDPTNIAVRLNTLLYEAANAEPVITDLNKVIVPNPADPKNIVNISKQLFGNATITLKDAATGTYLISYSMDPYMTTSDIIRHGDFEIRTNDKSLYEDQSVWMISALKATNQKPVYSESSSVYGTSQIYYGWGHYSVSGSVSGEISASTIFNGYTNENYKAEWNLFATIDLGTSQGYFSFKDADRLITLSSESYGKIFNNTSDFSYEASRIDPLVYKPSCNRLFIQQGSEIAEFPQGPILNPSAYPDSMVEVVRIKSGTDCKTLIDVIYNGITQRM